MNRAALPKKLPIGAIETEQNSGVTGSWSTPIVINFEGREELIVSVPDKVQALDPKTGKVLWFARGLNPLIYTSTVYSDGIVFANGGFHGPDIVVRPGGKGDVTATHKVWEGGRTANRPASVLCLPTWITLRPSTTRGGMRPAIWR